ncbi:MAG: nucleoside hydrolase, partial [Acidimicrobiaceae bacterium]
MWIDTDTASDDAVALILALKSKKTDVLGISIVAGNVPIELGVQAAL